MAYNRNSTIGRGLAFPIRLSDQDRLAMVQDDANIRRSIRLIIFTVPGERVMRPDFGCEIHSLIFDPANDQTATLAERYVTEALTRWEPRIDLITVQVEMGQTEVGEMFINIEYRIKNEHDLRSLVYPYYLLPVEK
jgi:phage baseplate assembly protein W